MSDADLFLSDTVLKFIGPVTFLFTIHYCVLSMGAEALAIESKEEAFQRNPDIDEREMLLSLDTTGHVCVESGLSNACIVCAVKNMSINKDAGRFHNEDNEILLESSIVLSADKNIDIDESVSSSSVSKDAVPAPVTLPVVRPCPPSITSNGTLLLTQALAMGFAVSATLVVVLSVAAVFLYKNTDFVRDLRTGAVESGCEDKICQNIGNSMKAVQVILIVNAFI